MLEEINKYYRDYWKYHHPEQRPIKNVFQYINRMVSTTQRALAQQEEKRDFFKKIISKYCSEFEHTKEIKRLLLWLKDIADIFKQLEDDFKELSGQKKTMKRILYWKTRVEMEIPF